MAKLGPLADSVSCAVVRGVLVKFMTDLFWVLVLLVSATGAVGAEGDGMLGAASVVVVVFVAVPVDGVG